MPSNSAGRVYCGYSSRPHENDSGDEAAHGVDQHHRRQLAASQHVVADGELDVRQRADALVETLVAATDEDEVRVQTQLLDERLVEAPALRREQHDGRRAGGRVS
jgi:hypothetical protein